MNSLFCHLCHNILDLPGDEDYVKCIVCGAKKNAKEFENIRVITSSKKDPFLAATQQFPIDNTTQSKKREAATIKEKCPKCDNPEMEFHTMQLRSADEGQTVFYTCPKCRSGSIDSYPSLDHANSLHHITSIARPVMFQLAVLRDNVRVAPHNFGKEFHQSIIDELNGKYANKVIDGVGLCISVYDLLEVGDPIIYPSEGGSFIKAKFRLVVFRPFVGEVLIGRLKSCDEEGIKVSIGFFDDIVIPGPSYLQQNSALWKSDPNERVWVWNYDGNQLFMDADELVRFRVLSENFVVVPPVQKDTLVSTAASNYSQQSDNKTSTNDYTKRVSPFVITGSIAEDGLGLLTWWQ